MLSEPVFLGTKQISKQPRTCHSFPDSGPRSGRWCFVDRSLSLLKMVVMDSKQLLYKRYLFVKWPNWSKKAFVNPLGFSAEVNEIRKSMHTNSIDCPRIWIFVWLSAPSSQHINKRFVNTHIRIRECNFHVVRRNVVKWFCPSWNALKMYSNTSLPPVEFPRTFFYCCRFTNFDNPLNIRESLLINASNRHFDPFDSLYVFDHYSKGKARIKKSST